MIRFPKAEHAGKKSDMFVQHHDIAATILEAAGVRPPVEMDKVFTSTFLEDAVEGRPGQRDHVTVGWGATPTVITDRWWFNCKANGTGVLLYDLEASDPFARNVADESPDVVRALFAQAKEDAGESFPDWIIELARNQDDAPGCSRLAARA